MECPRDPHQGAGLSLYHSSIIPPYILEAIVERNLAPQEVVEIAQKTLNHITTIRDTHRLLFDDNRGDRPEDLTDISAKNVCSHFEKIFNFYRTAFRRSSYDDKGAVIHASVNFDGDGSLEPGYMNAFWASGPDPGHSDFVFGDGAPMIIADFTEFLDIACNEFTHAVIEHTGILPYYFQSGALNNSISNVFGCMIKQFDKKQKVEDVKNWLIGEGIWTVPMDMANRSIRDMENPGAAYDNDLFGKDPQPASMDGYHELPVGNDSGGVNIYSGIPNRAFVLAAKAIGGYSWEGAGKIWYESLTDPALRNLFLGDNGEPIVYYDYGVHGNKNIQLVSNAELLPLKNTFKIFADLTIKHARAHSQKAVEAVESAWKTVGVLH
ncbi:Translation initiation factor 3 subunit b [Actinomortierella ambigua]|nr:Translation initiation factor 3 subunit b [Actinomortierella ambigua]